MTDQERILANIRAITVEMDSIDVCDDHVEYLKLCEYILKQIQLGGSPHNVMFAQVEKEMARQHGPDFDLDVCIDYYIQSEQDG